MQEKTCKLREFTKQNQCLLHQTYKITDKMNTQSPSAKFVEKKSKNSHADIKNTLNHSA
jgi:hypothetical protein